MQKNVLALNVKYNDVLVHRKKSVNTPTVWLSNGFITTVQAFLIGVTPLIRFLSIW